MELAVAVTYVVCLCGISGRRITDDSKEQTNVGRRSKDMVLKDGRTGGSFYITYGSEEDHSSSDEYYEDEDEDEDEGQEGSESYEEYSEEEEPEKEMKDIDASTAEAEFVEYSQSGEGKGEKTEMETVGTRSNEKGGIEKKYKDDRIKDSGDRKSKKSKIESGKKNNEKGGIESKYKESGKKIKGNKKNVKSKKIKTKIDDEEDDSHKNKRDESERQLRQKEMNKKRGIEPKKKIGKIKARREKKKMKLEKEDDSYEDEEEFKEDGDDKRYENESDHDYDYDELKKQLEDPSGDKREITYGDRREGRKGKKDAGARTEPGDKDTTSKKGLTRKERKIKSRGRAHKIFCGKRRGKSRIKVKTRGGERRRGAISRSRGRRRGDRVKEGMDSFKRTENTRIFKEDGRDSRYGRGRRFRDMMARHNVKEYLKRDRLRIRKEREEMRKRRRKLKGADKAFVRKEQRKKISRIKKQRQAIGKLNQKSTKVKRKKSVHGNEFH